MILKIFFIINLIGFLFSNVSQKENLKSVKNSFNNNENASYYFKLFNKSFNILKVNYVDSLNESEIIKEGIKGLSKKLDPYTKLLEGSSLESYESLKKGKYGGVGIQITKRRDTLTVLNVFEDSPAYSEGIFTGDDIMMIDSTETKNLSIKECSNLIKGELDSSVVLHVYRSATKEKLKFELYRSNIKLQNVPYWGIDNDGVGYIKITKFSKNVDKDFKNALLELKENGLKKLIIDLRGNSGGLLNVAINMLDYITEKNDFLLEQRAKIKKFNRKYKSKIKPIIDSDIPIVVLINKSSASASEILSGAIQDLDRGIVIGEKSFGKGLVQRIWKLNDTLSIKLTSAKYYLPSGRLIQKQDYLDNGFLTDQLDKNDSLFYTKNGRLVKGGGGINPDIEIKKEKFTNFVNALWKEKMFLSFASKYVAKNKNVLNEIEVTDKLLSSFYNFLLKSDFKYFEKGEKDINKIKKIINDKNISINPHSKNISYSKPSRLAKELDSYINLIKKINFYDEENLKFIRNGLLREISRLVHGEKERIKVSLFNDNVYLNALDIIKSERYYEILGY